MPRHSTPSKGQHPPTPPHSNTPSPQHHGKGGGPSDGDIPRHGRPQDMLPTPEAPPAERFPDSSCLPCDKHDGDGVSAPYFQGSDKSADYIIDIWTQRDPLSLPPDIQAYLEAVSRSQYGTWEPNGFSDGLKWFLFKYGPRRGPPSRRYYPDADAIQHGMTILRAASTSAENQSANFFFPQGHEFTTEALREFPHYPWAADSSDAIDAVVGTAHLPYLEDPHDGFAGDEFIILGNVRLALPPGLPGPENGDVWRQIVAECYGQGHPAMQRVCLEVWSDASLCAQQAEHLGCIQFSVNDR